MEKTSHDSIVIWQLMKASLTPYTFTRTVQGVLHISLCSKWELLYCSITRLRSTNTCRILDNISDWLPHLNSELQSPHRPVTMAWCHHELYIGLSENSMWWLGKELSIYQSIWCVSIVRLPPFLLIFILSFPYLGNWVRPRIKKNKRKSEKEKQIHRKTKKILKLINHGDR